MSRGRRREDFGRIVVVGGGRAGVAAAEELRLAGFTGEVVLLGDEPGPPYDRPACSKGLLTGHRRPQDVRMPVLAGAEISWRLGRRVVAVDPTARTLLTDTDETYAFDGLVVATGARSVPPPGWPTGEPGLHALRGLSDAWALRRSLRDAERVVVVGAGLTGCEVASAVRYLARDCVLVDANPYLLGRAVGEPIGRLVNEAAARDGVRLRLGRRVRDLTRRRRGWVVRLDDGEELHADVVVGTTGERPDTGWLSGTGLDLTDGVLCDQSLRAVGAAGIVAAGTVARWPNLRYSAEPRRYGQWISALQQGRAAARTLLAGHRRIPPVTVLPRFWSDQFGLRIQVCGELPADAEVAVTRLRPGRRDVARAGVLAAYRRGDRLIGLVAVNAPHAFTSVAHELLSTTVTGPRRLPGPFARLAAAG